MGVILVFVFITAYVPSVMSYRGASSENIALNRPAEAMSVYLNMADLGPDKAFDGNLDSIWSQGDGVGSQRPWISVDLGEARRLSQVKIYSRRDIDQPETRGNWEVLASNDKNFETYTKLGDSGETQFEFGEAFTLRVEDKEAYRYVKVQRTTGQYTVIAEIEIIPYVETSSYEKYHDISQSSSQMEIKLLSRLNILESITFGEFMPEAPMTRGEAVRAAVNLFQLNTLEGNTVYFRDVEQDHPYFKDVYAAVQGGLITGNQGMFRPDDYISHAELSKILLYGLGYEFRCQQMGGYPAGVLAVAQETKLAAARTEENIISREEAARIFYRALNTNRYIAAEQGEWVEWIPAEPLLSSVYGLKHGKGLVTGNSRTHLDGYETADTGHVIIDGRQYMDASEEADQYLGQQVDYFLQENDETLFVFHPTDRNQLWRIEAEDIQCTAEDLQQNRFTYTVNGKQQSISLSSDKHVLLNDEIDNDYTEETFCPTEGYVILIDNNQDGEAEIVKIYQAKSVCVNMVTKGYDRMMLSTKDGLQLEFPCAEEGQLVMTDRAGEPVSSLEPDDIITIYQTRDKETARIVASDRKVTGTIQEVRTGNMTEIMINGLFYPVSESYLQAIENNPSDVPVLTPGLSGEFLLNAEDGALTWVKSGSDNKWHYAFMQGKEIKNLFELIQLRLFCDDGEFRVYSLSDRAQIDGMDRDSEEAKEILKEMSPQLIRYKVNAQGEILYLDSEYMSAEEGPNSLIKGEESPDDILYKAELEGFFSGQKMVYKFSADTVVFQIPFYEDGVTVGGTEYSYLYKILHVSDVFQNEIATGSSRLFTPYNLDEMRCPEVMLVKQPISSDSAEIRGVTENRAPIMMISDIRKVLDHDQVSYIIRGFSTQNKTEEEIVIPENTNVVEIYRLLHETTDVLDSNYILSDISKVDPEYIIAASELQKGDLIRYSGSGNLITGIERLFSVKTKPYSVPEGREIWYSNSVIANLMIAETRAQYGVIYRIEGNNVGLGTEICDYNNEIMDEIYNMSQTPIVIFDQLRELTYRGKVSDLLEFTYQNDPNVRVMYVSYRAIPQVMFIWKFDGLS